MFVCDWLIDLVLVFVFWVAVFGVCCLVCLGVCLDCGFCGVFRGFGSFFVGSCGFFV